MKPNESTLPCRQEVTKMVSVDLQNSIVVNATIPSDVMRLTIVVNATKHRISLLPKRLLVELELLYQPPLR